MNTFANFLSVNCGHNAFLISDKLLHTLAGLTTDLLTSIPNTLAFIRLGGVVRANIRRNLSNNLLVDPLDSNLGILCYRNFNTSGNRVKPWMRLPKTKVNDIPLHGSSESDTLNLQILPESFANPFHHITNQSLCGPVHRASLRLVIGTRHLDNTSIHINVYAVRQGPIELPLRTFNDHASICAKFDRYLLR